LDASENRTAESHSLPADVRFDGSAHGQFHENPMNLVRNHLNESCLATPEAVGVIRRTVAAFAGAAGMCEAQLEDVRLAVSEAVTNIVRHAYGTEGGQVHVTVRAVDDELWVLIADDGGGANITSGDPGLGWGLAIITEVCDAFALVERAAGGTEARMRFRLSAASRELSSEDR
jgi:serine/threonine-protein kinase RsbW